jgi:putative transcriptional regulator
MHPHAATASENPKGLVNNTRLKLHAPVPTNGVRARLMQKNNDATLKELRLLCTRHKAQASPAAVSAARRLSGLTQRECALLMTTSIRSWQQWEAGERVMKGRDFELFCLLIHSHPARKALLRLKIRRT